MLIMKLTTKSKVFTGKKYDTEARVVLKLSICEFKYTIISGSTGGKS